MLFEGTGKCLSIVRIRACRVRQFWRGTPQTTAAGSKLFGSTATPLAGRVSCKQHLAFRLSPRATSMMKPNQYVWALTWLLRVIGATICLAFFPIFFPLSWMSALHSWLGLGDIPEQPIFEYLARSTSAMYFAHGCVILVASRNVEQFVELVLCIAALNLFIGGVLLITDCVAPMPAYWTWLEGPPIMAGGMLLMWLAYRVRSNKKVRSNKATASD